MLMVCQKPKFWRVFKLPFLQIAKNDHLNLFLSSSHCISYLGKWKQPSGQDTGISIYNSAVNKKVPFILPKKEVATWYMCGPTVYAESHIGHASCYVKFDIIRRILENIFNINVICLLGITDIDDKIINKAKETGTDVFQLAKKYELDFFEDMESLRVLSPAGIMRVTENIPAIIEFCCKLIEKDFAYVSPEGDVYFMVSKGVTADILHEIPVEESSASNVYSSKRDPRDFALWKAAKANEPAWESPWGEGRPGWHIECSAMASKIFGSKIDLHSGGYDLLFPHHANEKSQSEAYHECSQWVNYWLHAGLLQVDDELKMSKSLNNTISIKTFLEEHTVNDFRILCLLSLYRKNMCYSEETLSQAKSLHNKLHNFINDCELYISSSTAGAILNAENLLAKLLFTKKNISSSLKKDFNTSQALLHLTDLVDEINKSISVVPSSPVEISIIFSCYTYVKKLLECLGISILSKKKIAGHLVHSIDAAVEFRNKIRKFAMNPTLIDSGEVSLVHYVDGANQIFKQKANIKMHSKEYSLFLSKFNQDGQKFYEEVKIFAKFFDSEVGMVKCSLKLLNPKDAKKVKTLFSICDSFRLDLLNSGIGIKDKGVNSTWIPNIKLDKILQLKL